MEKLRLTVDCKERWEDMRPCAGGRFCSTCAKPVLDLTSWPRAELVRHLEEHPDTCGRYLPEQLDPSLVPLDVVTAKARRGLFAALAALAIQGTLWAQERAPADPREQAPATPSVKTPEAADAPAVGELAERMGHTVCLRPGPAVPLTVKHRSSRWYVDHRFPFLHKRRWLLGRMSRARTVF